MHAPAHTSRFRPRWIVIGLAGVLSLALLAVFSPRRHREPPLPGKLLIIANGKLCLIDPDGRNLSPITDANDPLSDDFLSGIERARLSPDRQAVAYCGVPKRGGLRSVFIAGPSESRFNPKFLGHVMAFCWAPDGSLTVTALPGPSPLHQPGAYFRATPGDGRLTEFQLPRRPTPPGEEEIDVQPVLEWFPDGETFVSDAPRWDESGLAARPTLRASSRNTSTMPLTRPDDRDENVRVSPDGTQVLFSRWVRPHAPGVRAKDLFLAPVGRPNEATPLAGMPGPEEGAIAGYCWSPDGAWIAIQRVVTISEQPTEYEHRTEIVSTDGKRKRVVYVERTTTWRKDTNFLDWR